MLPQNLLNPLSEGMFECKALLSFKETPYFADKGRDEELGVIHLVDVNSINGKDIEKKKIMRYRASECVIVHSDFILRSLQ